MCVDTLTPRFSNCVSLAIGTGIRPVLIVITLDMEPDLGSGLDCLFDVFKNLSEIYDVVDILGSVSTT